MKKVVFYFGVEKSLNPRPSERSYPLLIADEAGLIHVDNLWHAWDLFVEDHQLKDCEAVRAAVMFEIVDVPKLTVWCMYDDHGRCQRSKELAESRGDIVTDCGCVCHTQETS
jgi:hypothetical protein